MERKRSAGRKRRGRGEGSIYQEADGRWVASVSRGIDTKGKRRRVKVRGATKAEVQGKLRELAQTRPAGDAGSLTVVGYLDAWLDAAGPKVAETSHERWEAVLRLHVKPYWGKQRLAALQPLHVEQFYAHLRREGAPAATQRTAVDLLSMALKRAVKLKLIPYNPAADVDKPRKARREMQVYDDEQVKRFLDAARPHPRYALFALAVGTGMRQGELLGLHWPDLDLDAGVVTVKRSLACTRKGFVLKEPKTDSSRRRITLPPFVVAALHEHRKRTLAKGLLDKPVFCTRSGKFIGKSNLRTLEFYPLLEKAGLPRIRFHDLRHTHASGLLSRGHSLRAVSARLGHSTPQMTLKIYAHCLPNDDRILAEGLQAMYGSEWLQNGSQGAGRASAVQANQRQ